MFPASTGIRGYSARAAIRKHGAEGTREAAQRLGEWMQVCGRGTRRRRLHYRFTRTLPRHFLRDKTAPRLFRGVEGLDDVIAVEKFEE